MKPTITIALMLGLLPATAFAGAHATLRPGTELAVGTPAELSITIDGEAQPPAAPRIAGASIRLGGQMSQTRIINGAATQQVTFVYTIVPTRTGPLEIPALAVATATGEERTEPIHANVTDGPVASAAATAAPDRAVGPEPAHAFITLDVPVKSLVVGQAVPIKIQAYFRGGTSAALQGLPKVTSDAFTLSELSDKPVQTRLEIRGEPYLQATWTATLSPAKPSNGKLGVELPVELAYRAAPRPAQHRSLRDVFGADPFADAFGGADPFAAAGDPFADMDTMFDIGPMQQVQTTLRATAGTLVVTDPPAAGRPAGFTGAVGHFDVALDPIAEEPRVGEPMTLSIRVTGTGNFDRVSLPGAADADHLKTYSIKSAFAPRRHEQFIWHQDVHADDRADARGRPHDPGARTGVLRSCEARLRHRRDQAGDVAGRGRAGRWLRGREQRLCDPSTTPSRIDPGGMHATLQPLIRQPRLWISLGGLVALTMVLVLAAWSRKSPRIAHVLRNRRIDRAVSRASAEMDRAATANDRSAFFAAARTALQTRLAASWNTTPEAITAHDVATRIGDRGASIRSVLEQADGVTYGGTTTPEPLTHWNHVVRAELANWKAAP